MIMQSDMATKARWWLFKRISALGWLICPEPHRSDLQAESPTWNEIGNLQQRAEDAEADAIRLVQEKMDMWERAFAAEDALISARRIAFETAIEIVETECRNMKASLPRRLQTPLIVGGNIIAKIKRRYHPVENVEGDQK